MIVAETSLLAYAEVAPLLPELEQRVLDFVERQPNGATNDEIALGLGLKLQTVCPLRHALVRKGELFLRGRRENQHGSMCAVVYHKKEKWQ